MVSVVGVSGLIFNEEVVLTSKVINLMLYDNVTLCTVRKKQLSAPMMSTLSLSVPLCLSLSFWNVLTGTLYFVVSICPLWACCPAK